MVIIAADDAIRLVFALRQELAVERDGADKSKHTVFFVQYHNKYHEIYSSHSV
jgi:hypothetical protein